MENIFKTTIILAFFSTGNFFAQHSLMVNVTNLKPGNSTVEIGLFNKEKGFLKPGQHYMQKKVKASGNAVKYTFENLPAGNYSVALYQDENSNGKCDMNMIGIPTEGFGFSNNIKPKFSAPSFAQTKIFVNKDIITTIKLIR